MRTLFLSLAAIAAVIVVPSSETVPAGAQTAPAPVTVKVVATAPTKCLVKQTKFRSYAKAVYQRQKIRKRARRKMDVMRGCASSRKASRNMLRFQREQSADRRYRVQVSSLTPFQCSFGRFAIPCGIVACESLSSGLWSAANPSGAIGPYQLLGHGAPWPVRTAADRLAHHRIARNLYLSQGSGPWVCKG